MQRTVLSNQHKVKKIIKPVLWELTFISMRVKRPVKSMSCYETIRSTWHDITILTQLTIYRLLAYFIYLSIYFILDAMDKSILR